MFLSNKFTAKRKAIIFTFLGLNLILVTDLQIKEGWNINRPSPSHSSHGTSRQLPFLKASFLTFLTRSMQLLK